jgi:NAD(P)H-nitrite reductase large subunit
MTRYTIIGQGAAGTSAAKTLRQIDRQASITIISRETDSFYSRIDLPDIVAGKYLPQDAIVLRQEQFRELTIECRMNEEVGRILPDEKAIEFASGAKLGYDKLLLATGSEPIVPPLPGREARGVFQLWTLDQARDIAGAAEAAQTAVVIGAGLIGLKAALALKKRGLDVAVVEKMPIVMPQQLDETAAGILADKIVGLGIRVFTGAQVNAIEAVDGRVSGILSDQGRLAADMVIMAVGVRPNIALARAAGLVVGRGIVTDAFLATSVPDIYAAGDVAEITDLLTGKASVPAIWPAAVDQGGIAALNMAGKRVAYDGATAMNAVEIAGIPLVSIGNINAGPDDHVRVARSGDSYRKIVAHGKTLSGVLFMGDIRQAGVAANLVLRHAELGDVDPLSPAFSFASVMTS